MDRAIVQPGALPQDTDILLTNKFALLGQAYQNMALLGTSTVVAGLAATPTSPTADLHVTIGVGTIYQMTPTDASASIRALRCYRSRRRPPLGSARSISCRLS